jgi:hypothetical protein
VEPPPVLQQLNSAIEQLTTRISPAVVQVLVIGYGPLEESNRGQTALITRETRANFILPKYKHPVI